MKALYYGDNLQVLRDSIATESVDHGQAVQHIEAEVNVYDELSFDEREAMLGTVRGLIADIEANRGGSKPTHH